MGSRSLEEAYSRIENECKPSENIKYLVDFIKSSKRGVAIAKGAYQVSAAATEE
jgi:UDP-N-acetylglucosamine acyltransferase